jgi:hypothetical protein
VLDGYPICYGTA